MPPTHPKSHLEDGWVYVPWQRGWIYGNKKKVFRNNKILQTLLKCCTLEWGWINSEAKRCCPHTAWPSSADCSVWKKGIHLLYYLWMISNREFSFLRIRLACQTRLPGGCSVCRFLWFPFNQLSIKDGIPRCVYSLANQLLEWTKGAENNQKTSRHSGPPGL